MFQSTANQKKIQFDSLRKYFTFRSNMIFYDKTRGQKTLINESAFESDNFYKCSSCKIITQFHFIHFCGVDVFII